MNVSAGEADPRSFVLNAERDYAHTFIQWKGTDACLDFRCECGWYGHWDGFFAYAIECGGCGKTWEMPSILIPREGFGNGCVVKPCP